MAWYVIGTFAFWIGGTPWRLANQAKTAKNFPAVVIAEFFVNLIPASWAAWFIYTHM